MDRDFTVGGREYKLCKIPALKQFHITRRVGPILPEILPALGELKKFVGKVDSLSTDEQLDIIAKFATPIINGLSKLSDQDSEMVLFELLSSVEVKQAMGTWTRIANGNSFAIELELAPMLQVAGRAFAYNLAGFFSALPAK